MYLCWSFVSESGSAWTHLCLLYSVDDLAVQRRLAQAIADGKLEGKSARQAILEETKKERRGGPAPRSPAALALTRALRELTGAVRKDAFRPEALRAEGEQGLRKLIEHVQDVIGVAEQLMGQARGGTRRLIVTDGN